MDSLCAQSSWYDLGYLVFGVMFITIMIELIFIIPVALIFKSETTTRIVATIIGCTVPYYLIFNRIRNIKNSCADDCEMDNMRAKYNKMNRSQISK